MPIHIQVHLISFFKFLNENIGVKEEIAEKLAASNLSTIKEGKNKFLETKSAIHSENLTKTGENMVHLPIFAATDNLGNGIKESM